jgi:hypothetical protein
MKRSTKPLRLSKQNIRVLSAPSLAMARGGSFLGIPSAGCHDVEDDTSGATTRATVVACGQSGNAC